MKLFQSILQLISLSLLLTACSSNWKAPVESRSQSVPVTSAPVYASGDPARKTDPVYRKESKTLPVEKSQQRDPVVAQSTTGNVYTVQPGDTLYAIARRQDVTVRQLIDWNNLENPYSIRPGQSLKLSSSSKNVENVTPVSTDSRYSDATKEETTRTTETGPGKLKNEVSVTNNKKQARRVDGLDWQWPVEGKVVQKFAPSDPARRGIKIAGQAGMQVTATESGEVVYSGDGLVGYGELIIIKHNQRYLSAYGHNRKRLVKEGDRVKRGTVIATMGQLKGKPLLHFEVRRSGKPADPMNYLP